MMQRSDTVGDTPLSPESPKVFPRTQTKEFAPTTVRRRGRPLNSGIPEDDRPDIEPVQPSDHSKCSLCGSVWNLLMSMTGSLHSRRQSLSHHPSIITHATGYTHQTRRTSRSTKNQGFGGFPMPYTIVTGLFDRVFPNVRKKVSRTVTIPHTMSYAPTHDAPPGAKAAPYISFHAIVGRNSAFHELSHEQMEELGGVEYRALNALLWIVGGVCPFISICVFNVSESLFTSTILLYSLWLSSSSHPIYLPADGQIPSYHLNKCDLYLLPGGLSSFPFLHLNLIISSQVFNVSIGFGIHKHRILTRRSIDGSIPDGIPHDILHGFLDFSWEYSICKSWAFGCSSILTSDTLLACIVSFIIFCLQRSSHLCTTE
jgi:hypothetical protein